MPSKDYIDGFNAAKKAAERVAKEQAEAATLELDPTRVKLSSGQKERTQVRLKYAEIIARGIRKLQP